MARALSITSTLETSDFAADLLNRLDAFVAEVRAAEKTAAATATATTRSSYRRLRPIAPVRAGRAGRGQMAQTARWRPLAGGYVGFNYADMNREEPQWIIQEIGTGRRAVVRVGGAPRPSGRPSAGATYVRAVRSQHGRLISAGLVFASGGRYAHPSSARTSQDQLYARSSVRGVPRRVARIRIQREIRGQHFVQKGGEAGFREYRTSVLAAARQQFRRAR